MVEVHSRSSIPVCLLLNHTLCLSRLDQPSRYFSKGLIHSLLLHANAELIPGTNYFAVFDHEFKQFFALHRAADFVL